MQRVASLVCLAALAMAVTGCRTSDNDRTDKVDVDGTECVVVRNGAGIIQRTDCNWEGE